MAPAKACLSQKPVAAWDLEESIQTAVIKTLTGCSSGTPTNSTSSNSNDPMETAGPAPGWMCLSRRKLLRYNLLAAAPGQVSTAPFVELEVKHDAASKGMLLMVHAAGECLIILTLLGSSNPSVQGSWPFVSCTCDQLYSSLVYLQQVAVVLGKL